VYVGTCFIRMKTSVNAYTNGHFDKQQYCLTEPLNKRILGASFGVDKNNLSRVPGPVEK
jgi:hypothetical protein